jgi:hypothetical protein
MTRLTEADLQAIEARLKAATPGPWLQNIYPIEDGGLIVHLPSGNRPKIAYISGDNEANAALIANAPQDLALLVGEVRTQRNLIELFSGYSCANTGYYGTLGIKPGECTCAPCLAKKHIAEIQAASEGK